jgi:hypothetical protein
MTTRIRIEQLKKLNPKLGETLRTNHIDCPAGEDTRERLYVTRPDDNPNILLGYCHNCGNSGYSISKGEAIPFTRTEIIRKDKKAQGVSIERPKNLISAGHFEGWPDRARAWLNKYDISVSNLNLYDICYNKHTNRVFIPYYKQYPKPMKSDSASLIAYQERNLYATGPKYITVNNILLKGEMCILNRGCKHIILVEDMLSAIKISQANTGYSSLPLRGTHLALEQLFKLHKEFDKIIIWLDNDGPQIDKQALSMHQSLANFGHLNSSLITKHKDPKGFTKGKINEILEILK